MDFHICDQSFSGKRCRTRFNSWQIERLEKIFITTTHYPDAKQIESLSNETGIPVSKMQVSKTEIQFNSTLIYHYFYKFNFLF